MPKFFLLSFIIFLLSCGKNKTIGTIERIDPGFNSIVDEKATTEIIGEGYDWSEGPIWVESEKMLLFSDVPQNKVYKWTEEKGVELYLTPSGYTGSPARGGEMGSNGLTLNKNNKLTLCQHGNRQLAWMDADWSSPKPVFKTIIDNYQGKKFNSPNDLVFRGNGDLYFTDPPYGLEKNMDDPGKEIPFQGVYRVKAGGDIKLLTDTITRPNGIVFTPDQKTLIVANSDSTKACWYAYDISDNDSLINPRIFYNVSEEIKKVKGNPDGLKIDKNGNVFASGPGGLWVFNKDAKLLGKLKFDMPVSNCALSPDEKTLYITADMYVLRIKMRN